MDYESIRIEREYLQEKALIEAEKEHKEMLLLKEEFEIKPAKIIVKQKTENYDTESSKSN